MDMRFSRILCLGAALVLSQTAFAETPFDLQTLALLDASMDFCTKANPEAAEKFKDYANQLEKDVPQKDLEAARDSKDYKEARKSISAEFDKLNKKEVTKTCSDFLKADK
jgi:hypothetical protein